MRFRRTTMRKELNPSSSVPAKPPGQRSQGSTGCTGKACGAKATKCSHTMLSGITRTSVYRGISTLMTAGRVPVTSNVPTLAASMNTSVATAGMPARTVSLVTAKLLSGSRTL